MGYRKFKFDGRKLVDYFRKDDTLIIPYGTESIAATSLSCLNSTGVLIPNSVREIELKAFQYSHCHVVIMSANIRTIRPFTFKGSEDLLAVYCMDKVRTIQKGAFFKCKRLISIDLSHVTTIGDGAFSNCFFLRKVDLNSTRTIGRWAFNASGVQEVVFSDEIMEISSECFGMQSFLKRVVMPRRMMLNANFPFGIENIECIEFI